MSTQGFCSIVLLLAPGLAPRPFFAALGVLWRACSRLRCVPLRTPCIIFRQKSAIRNESGSCAAQAFDLPALSDRWQEQPSPP